VKIGAAAAARGGARREGAAASSTAVEAAAIGGRTHRRHPRPHPDRPDADRQAAMHEWCARISEQTGEKWRHARANQIDFNDKRPKTLADLVTDEK
jgi:hypothetical protein